MNKSDPAGSDEMNPAGLPARPTLTHDEKLKSFTLQVERKTFVFTLMENGRGQFLRITEGIVGRRNHIIIPSTGLAEFGQMVSAMNAASADADADAGRGDLRA